MQYLIPKSARSVKLEIFKGLTVLDFLILLLGGVICFLVLKLTADSVGVGIRVTFAIIIAIFTGILVMPSPIVPNQKMYQSVKIVYNYLSSEKNYRRKVKKNVKK